MSTDSHSGTNAAYTDTSVPVPRRSATLAGLLALVTVVVVGLSASALIDVLLGIALGVLVAVAIASMRTPSRVRPLIGGVGVLVGVLGSVAAPGYLIVSDNMVGAGVLVGGLLVGVGVAAFRVDVVTGAGMTHAIGWLFRVAMTTVVGAVVLAVGTLDVTAVQTALGGATPVGPLLTPTAGTTAGVSFLVLSWLAFAVVWLLVVSLPPSAVVTPSRRSMYDRCRSGAIRVTGVILGGGGIVVSVVYLIGSEAEIASATIDATLGSVVMSTVLRSVVVQLLLVGVVLASLLWLLRWVGLAMLFQRPDWIPSVAMGVVLLGTIAVVVSDYVLQMGDAAGGVPAEALTIASDVIAPVAVVLAGVGVAVLGVSLILMAVPLLGVVGLLPPLSAGPRLVVFGLLILIVAGVATASAGVVLIAGVAVVLTWDIATYGLGQSLDVGVTPAQRDGEVLHGGAGLVVGVIALVGMALLYWGLVGVSVPGEAVLGAVVLAIVAVLLAVWILRR